MKIDTSYGYFQTSTVCSFGGKQIDFLPHLSHDETAFAYENGWVYVYNTNHRVKKFRLVMLPSGYVRREVYVRSTSDYVETVLNTEIGNQQYKDILKGLKLVYPKKRVQKMFRGVGLCNSGNGWVQRTISTHFDIYVRK